MSAWPLMRRKERSASSIDAAIQRFFMVAVFQCLTLPVVSRAMEIIDSMQFVLVSDAFRYEAAAELVDELNGKYRFKATLAAMLGVLPSYTALGMAALLPHEQLGYKPGGEVLVDGKPCAGLEQRSKILAEHAGVAV